MDQVTPRVCLSLDWRLEEAMEALGAMPRARLCLVGWRVPEHVMNQGTVQQELNRASAGNKKGWASMVTEAVSRQTEGLKLASPLEWGLRRSLRGPVCKISRCV